MAFLESSKRAPRELGRVLVLGLGKSGRSAAQYCSKFLSSGRVSELAVHLGDASVPNQDNVAWVEGLGATALYGPEVPGAYDLCIASPGIPPHAAIFRAAKEASAEVISEVEFAWRESAKDSTWVAITGTNGKTTTTAATAHVLQECGLKAAAVGNIGDTCIDAVAEGRIDVFVAEVSSYQLESTKYFAPNVAVLMNITPDHISWHGSFEAYCEAKYVVFSRLNQVPGAVAILDATNDIVRAQVRRLKDMTSEERGFEYIPVGTADGIKGNMRARCGADAAAYWDDRLVVDYAGVTHKLCVADDLQIKGEHNISNALNAAAVAVVLGADDQSIADALRSFAPLEHRVEPCGFVGGVACYNDSKGTNTDATMKALTAFPAQSVVILLGGDDKGTDLTELVAETKKQAHAAVCFGAAGQRFYDAFVEAGYDSSFQLLRAGKMEEALDTALSVAKEGDSLLLSPACASWDEFSSYIERGRIFKQLVAERASQIAAS